mgnify:CR=1 FL=1
MSYGFDRAAAWYYDHVFSEPPDDWLGDPEDESEEETEMEDTEDEKVYD